MREIDVETMKINRMKMDLRILEDTHYNTICSQRIRLLRQEKIDHMRQKIKALEANRNSR